MPKNHQQNKRHSQAKSNQRTKTHQQYKPTPYQILKKYFGFSQFRHNQLPIIQAINNHQNVLAVMPTGSGKSLCFQVPALMNSGTTLVISPLIALMKDQVTHLLGRGVAAGLLTSAMTKTQQHENLELFRLRKFRLFYVAPERLASKKFLRASLRANIQRLIVDEAHCISEWGHDFRPEYREISRFVNFLNNHLKSTTKRNKSRISLAAFTATATPQTQIEIINNLQLKNPQRFILPMIRSNLQIKIITVTSLFQKNLNLLRLIKKHQQENGIIYVYSRQSAQDIQCLIKKFLPKINSQFYHAGLKKEQRSQLELLFMHQQIQLLVATNAFGMGIDKSDIRYIIHYQIPPSLENYYQEIGRAGRDGRVAPVYLLHYPPDWFIQQSFINRGEKNPRQQQARLNKLKNMFYFVKNNQCRTQMISQYFGQPMDQPCGQCDVCLNQTQNETLNLIDDSERQRHQQLLLKRKQLAKKLHLSPIEVASDHILEQIAFFQPKNKIELLRLAGVGRGNLNLIVNLIN